MFRLPYPVWLLGWVSLATDAATEAIYPLMPFFLTGVLGAGAVSLGPTAASIFLWFFPEHYRTLFALTIVPGAVAVALIFFVPEENRRQRDATTTASGADETAPSHSGSAPTEPGAAVALPREFTAFM